MKKGRKRLTEEEIKDFVEKNGYIFLKAYRKPIKNKNTTYSTWYIVFKTKNGRVIDQNYASFKTNIKQNYNYDNKAYKIKNIYNIDGNIVTLTIINTRKEEFKTIFNLKHLQEVKKYTWTVDNDGYVIGSIDKKPTFLHRFLTNCPEGLFVDHINHDKLNNTDKNLNICTRQENQRNRIDNYKKWNIYGLR